MRSTSNVHTVRRANESVACSYSPSRFLDEHVRAICAGFPSQRASNLGRLRF